MSKNKLVCILRVKDGIFFAKEWLERMDKLVDEIVVVDNGSTDGTLEMLKQHPRVVDLVETKGFDEGRDKNLVYDLARKRNPDWLIWLDIDEVIEEGVDRAYLERLMNDKRHNKYAMRRYHFIDRKTYAASFGWLTYIATHDRLLWRESKSGYFENVIIDSPNVKGISGITKLTSIRIKHLGYINKKLVDRKADIYRKIIPEKEKTFQKMYLDGVKGWKWIEDRRNIKVKLTNLYLDVLSIVKFGLRGARKIKRMLT